jgi:hypothetical protein
MGADVRIGSPTPYAHRVETMMPAIRAVLPFFVLLMGCGSSGSEDACQPGDADGVVGGKYAFEVTVDDGAFKPIILKAQNTATVTIVLSNSGTVAHGFSVACISTPNDTGCSTKSCFPDEATIEPILPGKKATTKFAVPRVEGIYPISSSADGDAQAQFVVQ